MSWTPQSGMSYRSGGGSGAGGLVRDRTVELQHWDDEQQQQQVQLQMQIQAEAEAEVVNDVTVSTVPEGSASYIASLVFVYCILFIRDLSPGRLWTILSYEFRKNADNEFIGNFRSINQSRNSYKISSSAATHFMSSICLLNVEKIIMNGHATDDRKYETLQRKGSVIISRRSNTKVLIKLCCLLSGYNPGQ